MANNKITDFKDIVLENLKAMRKIEQVNKQTFKVIAYSKVIKQVEAKDHIYEMANLDDIKGIGSGIKRKLEEIFATGELKNAAPVMDSMKLEHHVDELQRLMNIGPVKARELVEKHGIRGVDDLRKNQHLLNDKQKLGLKHFNDFEKRIPRSEMVKHDALIMETLKAINAGRKDDPVIHTIAGSYRRGNKDSGDIDVLVSCKNKDFMNELVDLLTKKNYIIDTFANGPGKYMGVCKLPRFKTVRRLDIVYVPPDEYAFALLYFTGSQAFNIAMRKVALENGYSLSEHGLKIMKGENKGQFVRDREFKTEMDVFCFLKMTYVDPEKRSI